MSIEQLEQVAQAMVAPGKGIIAIDESNDDQEAFRLGRCREQ